MKVDTAESGTNTTADGSIVFPQGMPGFENAKRFRLFLESDQPNLFLMQAEDNPELCFSVTDPGLLKVQYELALSDEECALLELDDPADIEVLVLLYSKDEAGAATGHKSILANFLGPLIINAKSRKAIQKVLTQVEDFVTIRAG